MEEKSNPFAIFDQLTAARAELDATGFKSDGSGVGIDQHQLRLDAQRREKAGGPLRARERSGRRPKGMMKQIFG